MFGRKVALLKIMEPAQPPAPAQEQSYILGEDERQGELVVLAINEQAATIKVNNYGQEQLLTLKTNLPAPAAPLPVPGLPPGVNALPAAAAGGVAAMGGAAGLPNTAPKTTIPTRTLRLPPPPSAQSQPQAPALSPEEQFILLHAIQQNDNNMPPPPPVPGEESAPGAPPMPGMPPSPL